MIILDLVVVDEFNEPFHYSSQPLIVTHERLFENALNMDLDGCSRERKIICLDYESADGVALKMQMGYDQEENATYVTNLLLKINLETIKKWFQVEY